MPDLNVPKRSLNLSKIDIQTDEQLLVIAGRELRLMEILEEEDRVNADIKSTEARATAAEGELKKTDAGTIAAKRAEIRVGEQRLAIKQKRYRLLELDDERGVVLETVEASKKHIGMLEAEKGQQLSLSVKES